MTTEGAPSPDQVTGPLYVRRTPWRMRLFSHPFDRYMVCVTIFDPVVWGARVEFYVRGFFRRSSANKWIANQGGE